MKELETLDKMVDIVLAYKYKPKKKSGKKKKVKKGEACVRLSGNASFLLLSQ